jgi:tRNA (mo5U34)-methyltransferase
MSAASPSLPSSPDDPLLDDWYHTIDLGDGMVSHGYFDHRTVVDRYGIPDSLAGMTVLDVGAGDGFFSLEFERRGAARVLATDVGSFGDCDHLPTVRSRLTASELASQPWRKRFEIAHKMLGSRVEHEILSVYDLSPEVVGTFDVVFCADVLLHLRNPLQALLNIRSVCKGLAIVETPIDPDLERRAEGLPFVRFGVLSAEKQAGDHNTYWLFTAAALCDMLAYAGFERTEPKPVFELPPRGLTVASVVAQPT